MKERVAFFLKEFLFVFVFIFIGIGISVLINSETISCKHLFMSVVATLFVVVFRVFERREGSKAIKAIRLLLLLVAFVGVALLSARLF